MTRTLAWIGVITAGSLPILFKVLPAEAQPWNLSILGALGLFVAARLSFTQAFLFVALALVAKDAAVYASRGWEPDPLSWVFFLSYLVMGRLLLRRTDFPLRIGAAAFGASVVFYLVSNFAVWLQPVVLYEDSLAGLVNCYVAAIPFYRGTIIGDLLFSGVLFGAHAVLSQAYYPAERVVPIAEQIPEDRS